MGEIKDVVSIRERPASVEDRAVPDHWRGGFDCGFEEHAYQLRVVVTHLGRTSRPDILPDVMLAKVNCRAFHR